MSTAIKKLADRFTEADIDSEIVVMRLDSGEFFSLSGTGAAIWRLIDGQRNRDAVVTSAATEFHKRNDDIAEEVDEFLIQLKKMGLLATR